MNQNLVFATSNTLLIDQRTHNMANSLLSMDFKVTVIGIKKGKVPPRAYSVNRLTPWLPQTQKMFTFFYGIQLLITLLFKKIDVLVAVNTDTLFACYWLAKIKRCTLITDIRVLPTTSPDSLISNYLRKSRHKLCVSDRLAILLQQGFGVEAKVLKDYPSTEICTQTALSDLPEIPDLQTKYPDKKIILYQGKVVPDKGIEYMIKAIEHIENAVFVIVGDGTMKQELQILAHRLNLTKQVLFVPQTSLEHVAAYTNQADLGISLEEYTNKSHASKISSKIYNYINCSVPVLVSELPEAAKLVTDFNIGIVSESYHPLILAKKINDAFKNEALMKKYKTNLKKAKQTLSWEAEQAKFLEMIEPIAKAASATA